MPARPIPNLFSAARRVTDWARLFVSSSNLLFTFLLSFVWLFLPHLGPRFLLSALLQNRKSEARYGPTRRAKMLVTPFWSTAVNAATNAFPQAARPPT